MFQGWRSGAPGDIGWERQKNLEGGGLVSGLPEPGSHKAQPKIGNRHLLGGTKSLSTEFWTPVLRTKAKGPLRVQEPG